MDADDVEVARQDLACREGIPTKSRHNRIGAWPAGDSDCIVGLDEWARARSLDAVVWTALDSNFAEEGQSLGEQVMGHLQSLVRSKRDEAERYIRCAPRQIDTELRRQIEAKLQWTAADADDG